MDAPGPPAPRKRTPHQRSQGSSASTIERASLRRGLEPTPALEEPGAPRAKQRGDEGERRRAARPAP
eukprot:1817280-Alexandrium_andersonii.AAC.1